jgi:alpha-beta hydrolase superfamily lysophospholipase
MMVAESIHSVPASDDKPIRVFRWKGSATVRGIVQIAHGMGEHALRYRPIAHALVDAGYVVYANDHRGHGELAAQANAIGDFGPGGFPILVDDMTRVTQMARDGEKGKPLVLLGHSMGSFAAQLYLLDHSELLDVVDAYIADPLCGFNVNAESYGSLFAVAPRLATIQEIARIRHGLPMFLFVGDLDPVNAKLSWFQPLIDRYREGGLTDVSWHVYGSARQEVLNEINRPEVVANLAAWMDRVTGTFAAK